MRNIKLMEAHFDAIPTLLGPLIAAKDKGLTANEIKIILSNWDRERKVDK